MEAALFFLKLDKTFQEIYPGDREIFLKEFESEIREFNKENPDFEIRVIVKSPIPFKGYKVFHPN